MTSPTTSLKTFLSQHFAKGKRLSWFRKIIEHGCMFVYVQSIGCVLFGLPLVSQWLFGNPSLIYSFVAFIAGMLCITFAKMGLQSVWTKWFERQGYSLKKDPRESEIQITPVSEEEIQKVYDLFAQLPSTIENMLFEKQLRKFQKKNQLPKGWWEDLEHELKKQAATLKSVPVENRPEQTPSILATWNSNPNPQNM